MSELNYEHVFDVLVDKTAEYVTENNLKAMVLGISGGIDSTVVAAICHVDDILSRFIPFENFRKSYDSAGQIMHPHDEMAESDCWSQLCARHGEDVVNKVWSRHLASEFKRKKAPIYISRELYE